MTIMTEPAKTRHFEEFMAGARGGDLFEKVEGLSEVFQTGTPSCVEGLGLPLLSAPRPITPIVDDHGGCHDVIMLGSNSYLALTTHPRVVAASQRACEDFGYGMGAVPLYAGNTPLHRELEETLAAFLGKEDAILFPCGYSGNVGIISALCGPGDVVINDAANHASIFDGARLSGADIKVYLHRNMAHLERTLRRLPDGVKGRMIVTDGVFSMDGDMAPLDRIMELARKYGARVMVDDAHGIGVVGPTGRGTPEHYDCLGEVDVLYGTLSKAPGGIGGYCAGSSELIRYLRLYARTFFFSTALPAPAVAGSLEVFRLLAEDPSIHRELWKKVTYLLQGLQDLGFDTGHTESAIIPVIVGDEERLGGFQNELRHRGVFTNLVTYPAVRRKECRLRVNVMRTLTQEDMDRALAIFASVGRECGVIH
jgi:8-amino-7-oxononanoate synthase